MLGYRVGESAPSAVQADLTRLWERNLSLGCDARRRFEWIYREPSEPTQGVYLLTANEGGVPVAVGTAGATLRHFHARARRLRAALLVDLAVERSHRTLLPALELVRQVRARSLAKYDFTYGFPNKHARGVFKRAGQLELGRMTRYACVLRHAAYITRFVGRDSVAELAAKPFDLIARLRALPRKARAGRRFRLEWLDGPDQRFDQLWQAVHWDYPLVGERTQEFVRWRFNRMPGAEFAIAGLRNRWGEIRAYAVVRFERAVAHCHDFFGFKSDLGPLFDLLCSDLDQAGTACVSTAFFGADEVVTTLRSRGFRPREQERVISGGFSEASARERSEWLDPSRWHITDADEDS